MVIVLKKDIMPAFQDDVQAGLEFMKRVRTLTVPVLKLGFEAVVRYKDIDSLDKLGENLKICAGFPISLHAPLNHYKAESVDITMPAGFSILEKLVAFADRNGINLIVTHPNKLRPAEQFKNYSRAQQQEAHAKIAENVLLLNKMASGVMVAVENKYNPTTDAEGEGGLYSPAVTLFEHMKFLGSQKVPLVFDTAHYAINRAIVHHLICRGNPVFKPETASLSSDFLGNYGFFPETLEFQPSISEALSALEDSVAEIHHNDAALNKSYQDSFIFYEGLVPGRGSLVTDRDITGFLKQKELPVVLEVYEKDYIHSPNAFYSFSSLSSNLL